MLALIVQAKKSTSFSVLVVGEQSPFSPLPVVVRPSLDRLQDVVRPCTLVMS
jgi:hypothetical protein